MVEKEELYTLDEVAAYLKLSPITLRRYIKDNDLAATKIGRSYRVKESDLYEFINRKTKSGA